MTPLRLLLALLGAASLVLLTAACGGGSSGSVPDGVVAVVDGSEISREELDALVDRAKKGYEAQDQEFPKVGTEQYQSLQTQYLAYLVQREEFEKEADDLGITIGEKDLDAAVDDFVKSRFDGKVEEYRKALEEQGYTEADFRETLTVSVLAQKIFAKVTKDVEVTAQDVIAYYQQNQSQYRTPASRDVRHILVAEKGEDGQVDFAKSKAEADRVYAQLQGGADFAALAKEKSADPGSKDSGGKLTISEGQTVAAFDKVAFDLKEGVVSRPVKTEYGYHIIEALSPVRKEKITSLDDVRDNIRATLLQEKRNEVMNQWVKDLADEYEGKISYAAGFEPPELPEETTTETG